MNTPIRTVDAQIAEMNTPDRTVAAKAVKINAAENSSIMQFGDSESTRLTSYGIAMQRAIPNFQGDETRFASYPIFFLPDPQPTFPPGATLIRNQPGAPIYIERVEATSIRAASLLRIGNSGALYAQSRIHHIRQYNNVTLPSSMIDTAVLTDRHHAADCAHSKPGHSLKLRQNP